MNFRFVLTRSIELSTTFIPTTIDTRNLNLNLNNQNYFSSFIARSGVFINEVGTSFRQSAQNIGELIQDNAGKVGNFTTNFFQGFSYESLLINTEFYLEFLPIRSILKELKLENNLNKVRKITLDLN